MEPTRPIERLILELRGGKVIVDADLAALYEVSTKALNQAVKRNRDRFPPDFVFQLSAEEKSEVVTNCDHLARLKYAPRLPWAFTEHGALQAANVLRSERAIAMGIYIIRAFVQMREYLATSNGIEKQLAEIDRRLLQHDEALVLIWNKLKPLLVPPPPVPRRCIGFKP